MSQIRLELKLEDLRKPSFRQSRCCCRN